MHHTASNLVVSKPQDADMQLGLVPAAGNINDCIVSVVVFCSRCCCVCSSTSHLREAKHPHLAWPAKTEDKADQVQMTARHHHECWQRASIWTLISFCKRLSGLLKLLEQPVNWEGMDSSFAFGTFVRPLHKVDTQLLLHFKQVDDQLSTALKSCIL